MKPRKPLHKATPARAKELARYRRLKAEFFATHDFCAWCKLWAASYEKELHHFAGRSGALLCWQPGFRLVHKWCHVRIENNRNEAVKLGLRAPDNLFNRASKVIPK